MPTGYALALHDRVDSTSEEAKRLATKDADPTWVVASEQSAGRGRRGRTWVSEPGNLFASLLIRPQCPAARAAELSFVAALAVYDALSGSLKCKWPNDILLDGRKIAGILLESATAHGNTLDWVVIGIGINIASHPVDTHWPATSLLAENVRADRNGVMTSLAQSMADHLAGWERNGFGPVRDTWLARAAGLGEKITVRSSDQALTGIFETLDEQGALILRTADGTLQPVHTGDIFFN